MDVNFFTIHPFSVDYNSQRYELGREEKLKIAIATLVGLLFFGIGSILGFLGSSYYFRSKKVEELSKEDDPFLQEIEDVALSIINPLSSEEIDEHDKEEETEEKIDLTDLRQKFSKQIYQKMGDFITLHQEKALLTLLDEALQSSHPRKKFEELVTSLVNRPQGWGESKASHIKSHLLALFPENLKKGAKSEETQFPITDAL